MQKKCAKLEQPGKHAKWKNSGKFNQRAAHEVSSSAPNRLLRARLLSFLLGLFHGGKHVQHPLLHSNRDLRDDVYRLAVIGVDRHGSSGAEGKVGGRGVRQANLDGQDTDRSDLGGIRNVAAYLE